MSLSYLELIDQAKDDYYFKILFKAGADYTNNSFIKICKVLADKPFLEEEKIALILTHLNSSQHVDKLSLEMINSGLKCFLKNIKPTLTTILKDYKNYDLEKEQQSYINNRHVGNFSICPQKVYLDTQRSSVSFVEDIIGKVVLEISEKHKKEIDIYNVFSRISNDKKIQVYLESNTDTPANLNIVRDIILNVLNIEELSYHSIPEYVKECLMFSKLNHKIIDKDDGSNRFKI